MQQWWAAANAAAFSEASCPQLVAGERAATQILLADLCGCLFQFGDRHVAQHCIGRPQAHTPTCEQVLADKH